MKQVVVSCKLYLPLIIMHNVCRHRTFDKRFYKRTDYTLVLITLLKINIV